MKGRRSERKHMAETGKKVKDGLEKLSRALNRRKGALEKLRNGRPSAVNEKRLKKLLKQAQRRKRKIEADLARRAGGKGAEGEATS